MREAIDAELCRIIELIWSSYFPFKVHPATPEDCELQDNTRYLTGLVEFTGGWDGAVTIECSEDLGRLIASKMFTLDIDEVSKDDMLDCMGEMANITGGNIKALIPQENKLSIPAVIEGLDYLLTFQGGELISELFLTCEGEPLIVRVFKRVKG